MATCAAVHWVGLLQRILKFGQFLSHGGHPAGLGGFNGWFPGYTQNPSCVHGQFQIRQPASGLHGGHEEATNLMEVEKINYTKSESTIE